jgi:hypothetical protein
MARADAPQAVDEGEVPRQTRLLELPAPPAPVVGRERRNALGRVLAAQEAGRHRRVDDDADVVLLAEREDLVLDAAAEQAVRRLQRVDRPDRLRAPQLVHAEVRDAGAANHALLPELAERRPALLDVLVGLGPVDLVEVNGVYPEPPQAPLELAPDRVALQAALHRPRLVPGALALREHVRPPVAGARERLADHLLGVAEPVHGRRVDPVHAVLDRPVDRLDRAAVVLRPPPEPPARAAHRPGADADRREREAAAPERARLCEGGHGAAS